MSVRGWAESAAWEDNGSELIADVTIGATTLSVDWAGAFDDEGGTLELNGERLDYSGINESNDTVLLVGTAPAAAAIGDRVLDIQGGQVSRDYMLSVSFGEGDNALVEIPFRDRDLWPEGEYAEPVPVILSDDLEEIEKVPGRTPERDATYETRPLHMAALGEPVPIAHNTWTAIEDWYTFRTDRIKRVGGVFYVEQDGMYDLRFGATFDNNSTGNRGIRVTKFSTSGTPFNQRQVKVAADGPTAIELSRLIDLRSGESVQFEVFQTSGSSLDVLGDNVFLYPAETDCAILRVGPL